MLFVTTLMVVVVAPVASTAVAAATTMMVTMTARTIYHMPFINGSGVHHAIDRDRDTTITR